MVKKRQIEFFHIVCRYISRRNTNIQKIKNALLLLPIYACSIACAASLKKEKKAGSLKNFSILFTRNFHMTSSTLESGIFLKREMMPLIRTNLWFILTRKDLNGEMFESFPRTFFFQFKPPKGKFT